MLKEFQFQRSKQKMFAMDEGWHVFKEWECRSAFVPGKNALGQPRETLPNGNYYNIMAEITSIYGASFGTFYISTGDKRARDIHGGGAGLVDPWAKRQGWVPTYGCLRMQNDDGEELARLILEAQNAGIDVVLTVRD